MESYISDDPILVTGGKGGVYADEPHEVKQRVALVRVPFYLIKLLPLITRNISILLRLLLLSIKLLSHTHTHSLTHTHTHTHTHASRPPPPPHGTTSCDASEA
jgi:hypothetical protein